MLDTWAIAIVGQNVYSYLRPIQIRFLLLLFDLFLCVKISDVVLLICVSFIQNFSQAIYFYIILHHYLFVKDESLVTCLKTFFFWSNNVILWVSGDRDQLMLLVGYSLFVWKFSDVVLLICVSFIQNFCHIIYFYVILYHYLFVKDGSLVTCLKTFFCLVK